MGRLSLRSLLLGALVLPALALFVGAGAGGYVLFRHLLERQLGDGLAGIAAATAAQVNGEVFTTISPGDDRVPTRTFRHLLRQLEELRAQAGVRRAFAVDLGGRVTADTDQLPVGASLSALAEDQAELSRARAGSPTHSQVLFRGADGKLYLRGYAPIRDASGAVVGVVGVAGSAAFFAPLQRLVREGAALVGLSLLGLALLAIVLARRLARPIDRLVQGALRIGGGDLSTPVAGEPTREIGILARELEAMRVALAERDRQLKLMLAGVAHEVRNPLGGIELFAGLLDEELAGQPEVRAHVQRIRADVGYLQRIVEDFLAFARERPLQKVELDAAALLRAASELVEADAQKRQVALALDAESAPLVADEDLLRAAVVNLVKNAVQASPSGGTVRVSGTRAAGGYRIEIFDQGPGIPMDAAARIFEPFFTTREKGTGLGLPLARKIVNAHGGELAFTTRTGETRFWISLPLAAREMGTG